MRYPDEVTRIARYISRRGEHAGISTRLVDYRGAAIDAAALMAMGPEVGRDYLAAADRLGDFYAECRRKGVRRCNRTR